MRKNPFTAMTPLIPLQLPQSQNVVDQRSVPADQIPYSMNKAVPKGPRTPDYMLHDRMRPESDLSTMRRGVDKAIDKAILRNMFRNAEGFKNGMELAKRKRRQR